MEVEDQKRNRFTAFTCLCCSRTAVACGGGGEKTGGLCVHSGNTTNADSRDGGDGGGKH